jgi:transcriptional regulator with XRE-family HTH domain
LALWRKRKGWTQAELAARLDTTDASINRIENGKQNWTPEFLVDAARVFECSIYDLLPPDPNTVMVRMSMLDDEGRRAAEAMIDGLLSSKPRR